MRSAPDDDSCRRHLDGRDAIEPERVAAAAPYRSPHWLTVNARGLASLTLAVDLAMAPSAVAARLPKALIHHNVSGQPIHRLLAALDQGWHRAAGLPAFSLRQRFAAAAAAVRADGWPVLDGPGRWRRGELTVKWDAVRPIGR